MEIMYMFEQKIQILVVEMMEIIVTYSIFLLLNFYCLF